VSADARVLVIGCGAIAKELLEVVRYNHLDHMDIECLPAILHNRPQEIPAAVEERILRAKGKYQQVFVAYADCGTGGLLDVVLERHGVERLPGAHCYEFFAGTETFAALHEAEPGTFYLTDYLTRHFQRLVWEGLGLDRAPQLRDVYFKSYRRVVYLSQGHDAGLVERAREAADRLGLDFEHRPTGLGLLAPALVKIR
jgi:hypothetical protein